ncbi:MAG: hypothetical protein M1820_006252 [Bogoriella megaspora]|nr:MAG: hypothetical protein M1820_006252 [Bogoriella megaspora]
MLIHFESENSEKDNGQSANFERIIISNARTYFGGDIFIITTYEDEAVHANDPNEVSCKGWRVALARVFSYSSTAAESITPWTEPKAARIDALKELMYRTMKNVRDMGLGSQASWTGSGLSSSRSQ